jgi:hypothetical protein
MAHQFVHEPLRAEEADRLANACRSREQKLIVWTLLRRQSGGRRHEEADRRAEDDQPSEHEWNVKVEIRGYAISGEQELINVAETQKSNITQGPVGP